MTKASFVILFAAFFLMRSASAYVYTTDSSGTPLRWPDPVKPIFYANWTNSDFLSYTQIFNMFTNPLQRWKNTGSSSVDFLYYQSGSNPTSWGFDSKNAVFFQSQAPANQQLGSSTIGITYTYSIAGVIVETDIEFNDVNFNFTTNPSDSSRFGAGRNVYLENVATHEFGHALGLGHSAILQSSMMFIEDRGQSKPSCDDIQGLGAAYPSTSFSTGRGAISGSIDNGGGTDIFGAHVVAISKVRGTVVSGAITDPNGDYTISNLEPGDYYLMVEPFQAVAPISSLCGGTAAGCYYGTVNAHTQCTGATLPFKREFIEASAGTAQTVSVASGVTTAMGAESVACVDMTDPWAAAADVIGTAPIVLASNAGADVSTGFRGQMTSGNSQYYLLDNVDGDIKVNVLSYGIYSPLDAQVTLVNAAGVAIAGVSVTSNVFSNTSSYMNYDASVSLSNAAVGDYYVKVTHAGTLSSQLYPGGTVSRQLDTVPYYFVVVTVNDATSLLPSTASPLLTNNARCEKADSFSAYPDLGPGANSVSAAAGGVNTSVKTKVMGCGTIANSNGGDRSSSAEAIFSIWGFAFALVFARSLQRALAKSK